MKAESPLQGLTRQEAAQRLAQYGPNEVAEEKRRAWLLLLRKFWAPVPWMLELTVVLQLALGKHQEAGVIAILLVFNAVLSFVQENRANRALALLRQRLNVRARALRDGRWQLVAARELVPGDIVHVRLGDLVPADVRLGETTAQLDQSTLTGESLPVETKAGDLAYSGSVVRRGEATGEVTATGARTQFGRTAELVRTTTTASHLQTVIFSIVRYLVVLDLVLVAALLAYALATAMPLADVIPFALILLVASVPVALPATFTLATAFGALELSRRGVLVTQLSAIEEAAAMDVLVTDKTGTITENRITVAAVHAIAPVGEDEVLRLGALACDEATQDPIDLAILAAARARGLSAGSLLRTKFLPFDPATRRSEAIYEQDGQTRRVAKGGPRAIAALTSGAPEITGDVERLAAQGYRVLAVGAGEQDALQLIGLIALEDPPREDSATLVDNLHRLGVRVIMATGDNRTTAQAIAARVGIGKQTCEPEVLRQGDVALDRCDVFARVYPEDKLHLVRALQEGGHIVGMTGDGVNDAPALKQAEVGVAVANATDVAKAAASLVLTDPGLPNVLGAVETSRRIYQRMLTYILNKIVKTLEIAIFLSVGVMLTGVFVITPKLIVLLLFTNDFVTMSIATDNVTFSLRPERWKIRNLMLTAAPLSALILVLSFAVFFAGRDWLHLPLPQLQTLIFITLVFTGLGTVYLVRERRHFWRSRPSRWLLISTVADVLGVSSLAWQGILMSPLSPSIIAGMFAVVLGYLLVLDFLKVWILRRLAGGEARH
jgi:H+-transporting ATPase